MSRLRTHLPGIAALCAYRAAWAPADVGAGLAVAAVSLPMALAYAAMVGVPAVAGLHAAILPLVAYAVFGPSPKLIVGPDTAMCALMAVVLAGMDLPEGEARVAPASALAVGAGAILVIAGAAGFGRAAVLLAKPVLVGFLTGIALTLIGGQLARLTGVPLAARGLFRPAVELAARRHEIHAVTLVLGLGLTAFLLAWPRLVPRIPGAPVALAGAILLSAAADLGGLGVALVGPIPRALPHPALPLAEVPLVPLGEGAAAMAIIGFASGIVPARAFGARDGVQTDPNAELRGFGIANLVAGLMQGFAVTGTSSRTAVAYAAGSRSPLAGLVASATLAAAARLLARPLALLPQATLGAILVATAIGMVNIEAFRRLWRIDQREFWIAAITALGVVAADALRAVALAVVLTLANYLRMAARPRDARLGRIPGRSGLWKMHLHPNARPIPGIVIYQFQGSPVFVSSDRLGERLPRVIRRAGPAVRHLVLDCSAMTVLDSTGVEVLERAVALAAAQGLRVSLGGGHSRFRRRLKRSPVLAALPWFDHAEEAVAAIERGEIAPLSTDARDPKADATDAPAGPA